MQSFNDCVSWWSNELQWESECGSFSQCFLLVITITITKVSGPYVVAFLNLTSIYEWYVARLIVKDGHQNDMLCKGIKLCAQSIRRHF